MLRVASCRGEEAGDTRSITALAMFSRSWANRVARARRVRAVSCLEIGSGRRVYTKSHLKSPIILPVRKALNLHYRLVRSSTDNWNPRARWSGVMTLGGERRRLGAFCPVQYHGVEVSEEEPYRILEAQVQLTPVKRTNVLHNDEHALGHKCSPLIKSSAGPTSPKLRARGRETRALHFDGRGLRLDSDGLFSRNPVVVSACLLFCVRVRR